MEYKNRYNDVYSFTKDEENNVLWEGNFTWSRLAYPNDYGPAYEQYVKDEPNPISFEDFQVEVHKYDEKTYESMPLSKKYQSLVKSDMSKIHMVDPSGGPYLTEGMHLGKYLGEGFENLIIDNFESIETGYKIITKKCI